MQSFWDFVKQLPKINKSLPYSAWAQLKLLMLIKVHENEEKRNISIFLSAGVAGVMKTAVLVQEIIEL